ncbi:stage V sporulation protein R [Janthinobacterium sp. BJB446]|uniref:SpoVR family protein n=1 Tax=Janthinobacterium sp. BJB446 TaxID=2048009 RepID=UPI000C0E93BD|nr:SpoVR family protein [Janthinobacterium sp. BJB446]PHV22710.1 stage V sporulation protein R [Janthinobacterium sp. BJB446]
MTRTDAQRHGDTAGLDSYATRIEALARELGLAFAPVEFELVPESFMAEIAIYGLPVRMRHWSFGVRYIHQLVHQKMGNSHMFEVMFPGDPCHAYMAEHNSVAENTLVTAHVLGHADFASRNALFLRFGAMAGQHILEQSAARAQRLEMALQRHGQEQVEAVLDAALALEQHVDIHAELHRPPYAASWPACAAGTRDRTSDDAPFAQRYRRLPGEAAARAAHEAARARVTQRPLLPPQPEYDLLWFIAQHAPELADWERDIFLAVREESFYFYPVYACQIMNEGWASYWHARLLREADFLPPALYLSAIKSHSDVVRPYAGEHQQALAVNPYHLGFCMWEHIIEREGLARARQICRDDDDCSFIRNYLDGELADRLGLFVHESRRDGETRLASRDLRAIREAILAPKYNYGAPCIAVTLLNDDGSLVLRHDHQRDGRGLDLERAEQVLAYIARVWRRPVTLHTADFRGTPRVLRSKSDGVPEPPEPAASSTTSTTPTAPPVQR